MNQVYVCGTYFSIYVSILKTIYRADKKIKSLLILNDHTPGIENIISSLKENNFFDYYLPVPFRKIEEQIKKEKGFVAKFFRRNQNIVEFVENNSEIGKYADFIKDSEINLTYLWGLPSAYFILRYPGNYTRVVEEGTRNYILKTSAFKFFKRKYILRTFIGDGLDNAVKEVQVQYPEKLDTRLRQKATLLELMKMQKNLSADDNNRVISVFMKGHAIDLVNTKKLIVVTQPISEDGYTTEEYKIQLFAQIIDQYAKDYQVYLKPHPRELTDYKQKLNRKFVEIPRSFPLEMFDLMKNIVFDEGVTLFSSCFTNLSCIKHKVNLGKDYVKELLPGRKIYV